MKRGTSCVAVLFFLACGGAFAQESSAPKSLRAEQELPSRYPYVIEDALKYCRPEKGFWVDLGAGKAQVTIPLIEATGNPVVMLDPNEESMAKGLELAREKGLEDRLFAVVGVAEEMPFLDDSVDFLISRGSIFFWDDPAKGLQEVVRVLKPGAKAYIGGGAGSGYTDWATEKLIEGRKQREIGDTEEAEKWRHFNEIRKPDVTKKWAEDAGLEHYTIMGEGAVSAADKRVGQGLWIVVEKPAEESTE